MRKIFIVLCAIGSIIIHLPSIMLSLVYKPYRVRRMQATMDRVSVRILKETPYHNIQDPKQYFSNLIEQVFIDKIDVADPILQLWDNKWVPKHAPEFVFDGHYIAAVIGRVWLYQIHDTIKEQCEKYTSNQELQFAAYKNTLTYLANMYIYHDKFDELVQSYQPRLSALYNVTEADFDQESFVQKIDVDLERNYHTNKIKTLFEDMLGGKLAARMAEDLNERS